MLYIILLVIATISCVNSDDNVVIDLKFLNKNVDLIKVKNAGIQGVIHMITQGTNFQDPTYIGRKKQAEEAGLLWGAYHIADGSPGAQQAINFLTNVGNDDSILLALGIEKSDSSMDLKGAEDFVNTVYQARKKYPLVYGHDYVAELVKDHLDSVLTKCGLWTFQYQDDIIVPSGWSNWTLWQYTDGVNGPKPHGVDGVGPCGRDKINKVLHPNVQSLWSAY